jgi:hypothetical protein
MSRRLYASSPRLNVSTFSCDIAYDESPTASRASALSLNTVTRTIFPARKV